MTARAFADRKDRVGKTAKTAKIGMDSAVLGVRRNPETIF